MTQPNHSSSSLWLFSNTLLVLLVFSAAKSDDEVITESNVFLQSNDDIESNCLRSSNAWNGEEPGKLLRDNRVFIRKLSYLKERKGQGRKKTKVPDISSKMKMKQLQTIHDTLEERLDELNLLELQSMIDLLMLNGRDGSPQRKKVIRKLTKRPTRAKIKFTTETDQTTEATTSYRRSKVTKIPRYQILPAITKRKIKKKKVKMVRSTVAQERNNLETTISVVEPFRKTLAPSSYELKIPTGIFMDEGAGTKVSKLEIAKFRPLV